MVLILATLACIGPATVASAQEGDGPIRTSRDRGSPEIAAPVRTVNPIGVDPFAWLAIDGGNEARVWREAQKKQTEGWLATDKNYPTLLAQAERLDAGARPILIAAGRVYEAPESRVAKGTWRSSEIDDYLNHRDKWRSEFAADVSNLTCEPVHERACLARVPKLGSAQYFDYMPGAPGLHSSSFQLPATVTSVVFEDDNAVLAAAHESGGIVVRRLERGQLWSAAAIAFTAGSSDRAVEPQVGRRADGRQVVWLTVRPRTGPAKLYVFAGGAFRPFAAPPGAEIAGVVGEKLVLHLSDGWAGDAASPGMPAGSLIEVDLGPLLGRKAQLTPKPILKLEGRPDVRDVVATPSGILVIAREGRSDALYLCRLGLRGWEVRRLPAELTGTISVAAIGGSAATVILDASDYPNGRSRVSVNTGNGLISAVAASSDFDPKGYSRSTFSTKALDGAAIDYAVLRKVGAPKNANAALLMAQPKDSAEVQAATLVGRLWLESGGALVTPIAHRAVYDPQNIKIALLIDYEDLSTIALDAASKLDQGERRVALIGIEASGLTAAVDVVKHPSQWAAAVLVDPLTDPLRLRVTADSPAWVRPYGIATDQADRSYWARLAPYDNLNEGTRYAPTLTVDQLSARSLGTLDGQRFTARMNAVGGDSLAVEAPDQATAAALSVAFLLRVLR